MFITSVKSFLPRAVTVTGPEMTTWHIWGPSFPCSKSYAVITGYKVELKLGKGAQF